MMNLVKCSSRDCSKYDECKRSEGRDPEVAYGHSICVKSNDYKWFVVKNKEIKQDKELG